jgi:hypothetical protein
LGVEHLDIGSRKPQEKVLRTLAEHGMSSIKSAPMGLHWAKTVTEFYRRTFTVLHAQAADIDVLMGVSWQEFAQHIAERLGAS